MLPCLAHWACAPMALISDNTHQAKTSYRSPLGAQAEERCRRAAQ